MIILLPVFIRLLQLTDYSAWASIVQKFFKWLLFVTLVIGIVPISANFGSFVSCYGLSTEGVFTSNPSCWTDSDSINPVLAVTFFPILLIVAIGKAAMFFEDLPYDDCPLASAHGMPFKLTF